MAFQRIETLLFPPTRDTWPPILPFALKKEQNILVSSPVSKHMGMALVDLQNLVLG